MPDRKARFGLFAGKAERAFMEKLYTDHRRLMYHTARSVTGSGDMADEIVSDACMLLMGKADLLMKLDGRMLSGYIVTTVRNTAYGYLNRQKARDSMSAGSLPEEMPDGSADILDELITREAVDRLKACIGTLPREDRDLMYMKYVSGQKDADIARVLGISAGAVRERLFRLRGRLVDMMKGTNENGP